MVNKIAIALGVAVLSGGLVLSGCSTPKAGSGAEATDVFDSIGNRVIGVRARPAECIVPVPGRQFRGDHVCDVPHPVWSDASRAESLTREPVGREHESDPDKLLWGDSDTRDPSGPATGITDREALAWERYCDGGWGMTDEDWSLINDRDLPSHITDCIPPK